MDRDTQLTPHFNLSEFIRPQDPMPSKAVLANLQRLAERLEKVRALVGKPIKITSGYRTAAHNKAVGGAPGSYHLKGMAADIIVPGMSAPRVQGILHDWNGGMGSSTGFTHLDIRAYKARWRY